MADFTSYSSTTNDLLKSILKALVEQNKLIQEQTVLLQTIATNTAP
jgi:hypothetical protein